MCFTRIHSRVLFLITLLVTGTLALAQTTVNLANPGFELPTLSSSGTTWYGGVQGWSADFGVGTTWALPWLAATPAPQGNQFVWADLASFNLTQIVGTVEANTRYVFTIDGFALQDTPANNLEVAIDVWDPAFSAYTRTVYSVFRPSWLAEEESFLLTPLRWQSVEVRLDSSNFPALVGQSYRVRVTGYHYAIDNARLIKYAAGESPVAAPVSYYLSASGQDSNSGVSPAAPWRTFAPLNARILAPGSAVYLRRGDSWTGELNLRGEGTAAAPIILGAYGDTTLPRPIVYGTDLSSAKAIVVQRPSYWRIQDLDCRNSKVGLYLRYANAWGQRDVQITNCHFQGNTDPTLDPANNNYELSWSYGIFLGGHIWNSTMEVQTVLDGLIVSNCTFQNCAGGFGTGWYYPVKTRQRLKNVTLTDCLAVDCYIGAFALFNTDTGLVQRCHSLGGGVDGWTGSALGIAQSCQNLTIQQCTFDSCDRRESGDGVGFDFEGDNQNCSFINNIVANNSGSGILILSTDGPNLNITVSGNTFYNNVANPWNSEINSEILCGSTANTGTISNNGFYRRDTSVSYFSNYFSGFTLSANRQALYDPTREKRWWNFDLDGDLEAWNGFNDWASPAVAGGVLTGASTTGVDPFVQSAPTWINPFTSPYLWLRMRSTAGPAAQIFYITDADPAWTPAKMISFPASADGVMRNYFVDLRQSNPAGLITQLRLDPPFSSGGQFALDSFRSVQQLTTTQPPPQLSPSAPLEMTFTSSAAQDGWVLETAAASGTGGTLNSSSGSIRLGDDAANARYRALLSFDTSGLPDNALVVSAQLAFTRTSTTGSEPWTYGTRGLPDADRCQADLATPYFGSSANLEAADWQSAASSTRVANFIVAYMDGLTVMDLLDTTGTALVSKTGTTQFRVMIVPGTDNDGGADYINIASGNAASNQPRLRVKYYLGSVPASVGRPDAPAAWTSPLATPAAPSLSNAQDTKLDITVAPDANPTDTEYAIYCLELGQWLTASGSFSASPVWLPAQGSGGWNTTQATGLQPNTDYRFRLRARTPPYLETADGPLASKLTTPVELQSFSTE